MCDYRDYLLLRIKLISMSYFKQALSWEYFEKASRGINRFRAKSNPLTTTVQYTDTADHRITALHVQLSVASKHSFDCVDTGSEIIYKGCYILYILDFLLLAVTN